MISAQGGSRLAKLLYRLGSFIARHKWWSVAAWVVLLAAIVTPLIMNEPEFDDDIEMTDLESIDTNDKISDEFGQDSEKASIRIVFHSNSENGITEENTMNDIQSTLDDIKNNDDYVESITDPFEAEQVNEDETTAFADVTYVVSQTSLPDSSLNNVNNELDDLEDDHAIQTELTGNGLTDIEIGGTSEVIGVVTAFVILLITFGSLVVAGTPIISAIIGLGSSVGIIALLTYAFDIPNLTLSLAIMIGLAVGIDYALFILFRYKKIIQTEKDHIKAIGLSVGTAGSAVVFAGVAVIIAVCGLSLIGIDFLAVMGFASAISVFMAVLSALTLLPALISFFHKRIRPKKQQAARKDTTNTPWSKFVVGKPLLAAFIGLLFLVLMSIPMFHMSLGIPDDGMQPADSTEKQGYDLISDEFGEGYNGQIAMLVNVQDQNDQETLNQDLENITDDIDDMNSVDIVAPAQLNENEDYALISIIPEEGPNAESTNNLVHDLRDYNDEAQEQYDFETEISGQSVIDIDMSQKLNDAIPVFAGVIVALAFILLMVVFRSIIIPLKAVGGFVLSLSATLGFTTLVMQDGVMSQLFGVDTPGPLLAFLPVIVIGLLFGLAMDYEVFLMSRIHEEYSKTGDNEHSIKVGIKESGPVIVAAALIMFSVFIAFAFQDDIMIKSMGMALAFGVLFDAFIVRMMLIPALTKLFGRTAWYMPKWLNRILPKVDIEGHALQDKMSSSNQETLADPRELFRIGEYLSDSEMNTSVNHLYNELLNSSSNREELFNNMLFNALLQYAKDNNQKVYDKYSSNTDGKNYSETESPVEDEDTLHSNQSTENTEIKDLLNEQKQSIDRMNEILSRYFNQDK